jgi:hypothetical protein
MNTTASKPTTTATVGDWSLQSPTVAVVVGRVAVVFSVPFAEPRGVLQRAMQLAKHGTRLNATGRVRMM